MAKSKRFRLPLFAVQNTEIGSYKLLIKLCVFPIFMFCIVPLSAMRNTEIGSYKLLIKLCVFSTSDFYSVEHRNQKVQVSNKTFCIFNFRFPYCKALSRHLFHSHLEIAKTHVRTRVGMLVTRETKNLLRPRLHRENAFGVIIITHFFLFLRY